MTASRCWPKLSRETILVGLKMSSIGVPSGNCGMSASGRMRVTTPLAPWRLLSLSPTPTAAGKSIRVAADSLMTKPSSNVSPIPHDEGGQQIVPAPKVGGLGLVSRLH